MVSLKNNRILLFVLVCAASAALATAYGFWARAGAANRAMSWREITEVDDPLQLRSVQSRPHVVFINKQPGPGFGRVALVPLDAVDGPRYLTPLQCERMYFAGDTGICLRADSALISSYHAETFDRGFGTRQRVPLQGLPSRTRISPSGGFGATTVFVRGDSYASGGFSTRTTLMDLAAGRRLFDLEDITFLRDGRPYKQIDFNYWGVTFANDPDLFYATLSSGGNVWLIRGSIARREAQMVRDGIECPSLSPDQRRLVYKARIGDTQAGWRLHVVALDSLEDTTLAEQRSVDDQATWLDDDYVVYALRSQISGVAAVGGTDLWMARADGSGPARLFMKYAYSPAIVRPIGATTATHEIGR